MTFTPTKNTSGKKRTPIPIDDRALVDQLRGDWIAACSIDTDQPTENEIQAYSFRWNVAGHARQFMEWVHFQPQSWTAPSWYSERLGRVAKWLQAQEKGQLAYRREDALKILFSAWSMYLPALQDSELSYDILPSLYTPEDFDEFGPLDMPLPYLPHWRVIAPNEDSDRLLIRQEAARIGEEFTLYSGLVTWLNLQIGLDLLDLEENPF